ncbi:MAG: glycerol-3-phosphate acyltransferase PlsY [Candidatus Saganbacteria bacterium]|uniref:Glycerol-3-phosphate acyltransferase n=1 Tax=Candidatus Saganbacteria bacterium TaxID=2575572 RepID=A0A833L106_UNCSA|nr:MAG: glycerol-3-phosphate acyltransferase PlsY [Candidatus Saganbacteria bacterium]
MHAIVIIAAYLIGSVPFGVIVACFFQIDITKQGSGNIGATNVLRTLGALPGILVLVLDLLKGTFAAYLGIIFLHDPLWVVLAGVFAILGHMFSIYLRFKGGKGAAVGLGVLLAITPEVFLISAVLVILIVAITRYVSLASMIVPIIAALLMVYLNKPLPYIISTIIVFVVMVIKHKSNIKRIISGTERKIGKNG